MPSLVELKLFSQGASCITTETLSLLTNQEPPSGLCLVPKLQDIDLHCYGVLDGPAWADMIQSRRMDDSLHGSTRDGDARVARIRRILLHWGRFEEMPLSSRIDLDTIERLRQFKREWLDISIIGSNF